MEENEMYPRVWDFSGLSPHNRKMNKLELNQFKKIEELKQTMITKDEVEDIANCFDVIRDNAEATLRDILSRGVFDYTFDELCKLIDDLSTLKDVVIQTMNTN